MSRKKQREVDPAELSGLADEISELASEIEERGYLAGDLCERLEELAETTTSEGDVDVNEAFLEVSAAIDHLWAAGESLAQAAVCLLTPEEEGGEGGNTSLTPKQEEG